MASCAAHIVIGEVCYVFIFRVLASSSHDIILGCDFLTKNKAVIDYLDGQVFFQEFASFYEEADYDSRKLRVASAMVLPPNSMS